MKRFLQVGAAPLRQMTMSRSIQQPFKVSSSRFYSDAAPPMDEYESKIFKILETEFKPTNLEVRDVSGGCGSMFAILVESDKFNGVPMVKQHRLVNEVLKDEIANWHGLQLRTKAT